MKTVKCTFKSNGEDITVTAIINNELSELSKSRKNQATDIIDDFIQEEEVWCLFFEMSPSLGYEIQFKVDKNETKTLIPVKAITWEGGEDAVITDVQNVTVKTKHL